jgi:hypothetical protein
MSRHERAISKGRRSPSRFTQADVTRVIRAAQAAKLDIAVIKIEPDGTILVIPGTPSPVQLSGQNPWDA